MNSDPHSFKKIIDRPQMPFYFSHANPAAKAAWTVPIISICHNHVRYLMMKDGCGTIHVVTKMGNMGNSKCRCALVVNITTFMGNVGNYKYTCTFLS